MELRPADPVEYNESALGFVDILGFSELVVRSVGDTAARVSITRWLATDDLFAQHMGSARMGHVTFFSDCLVVTMGHPRSNMIYMVREIGLLARYLLSMGFATRGAITAGFVHHREKSIVGPALVEAYRLEQRAVFPRITITASLLSRTNACCAEAHIIAFDV